MGMRMPSARLGARTSSRLVARVVAQKDLHVSACPRGRTRKRARRLAREPTREHGARACARERGHGWACEGAQLLTSACDEARSFGRAWVRAR
eukprot:5021689-Pleurochrysis_carterae.AAC.1